MSFTSAVALLLGVCALPVAALAQGNAAELGFHYAYNSLAASNENGASFYGEYFLKGTSPHLHGQDRLGLIGEFGGSGIASGSLYTYLAGIRFNTEWKKSHLVLHSEYKAGGAHARVNGVNSAGANVSFSRNSFALGIAGVGLDLRLGQHYVLTLLQTDFPAMEVPDAATDISHWSGDLRVSAGIGYRFGSKPFGSKP
jgi:hypothetical protein